MGIGESLQGLNYLQWKIPLEGKAKIQQPDASVKLWLGRLLVPAVVGLTVYGSRPEPSTRGLPWTGAHRPITRMCNEGGMIAR